MLRTSVDAFRPAGRAHAGTSVHRQRANEQPAIIASAPGSGGCTACGRKGHAAMNSRSKPAREHNRPATQAPGPITLEMVAAR